MNVQKKQTYRSPGPAASDTLATHLVTCMYRDAAERLANETLHRNPCHFPPQHRILPQESTSSQLTAMHPHPHVKKLRFWPGIVKDESRTVLKTWLAVELPHSSQLTAMPTTHPRVRSSEAGSKTHQVSKPSVLVTQKTTSSPPSSQSTAITPVCTPKAPGLARKFTK